MPSQETDPEAPEQPTPASPEGIGIDVQVVIEECERLNAENLVLRLQVQSLLAQQHSG